MLTINDNLHDLNRGFAMFSAKRTKTKIMRTTEKLKLSQIPEFSGLFFVQLSQKKNLRFRFRYVTLP